MDIVQSLAIIHRVYQAVGLTNLHLDSKSGTLKRSYLQTIYNICILLVSISLLCYVLVIHEGFNEHIVGEVVNTLELFAVWGAYVFGTLRCILRKGSEKEFYDKVREIDGLFKSSLNINIDNRPLRVKTILSSVSIFVFYVATKGVIALMDPKYNAYWVVYMIAFIVCSIRSFQICIANMIVKRRYDKLVSSMTECQNCTTLDLHKLRAIRDLHNRLIELATILNNSAGISLLLNLGSDFIALVSNSFWLYIHIKTAASTLFNFLLLISIFIWGIPNMSNMLALAILSHSTSQSTTKMAGSLHMIDVDNMSCIQNAFIEQFSLQLLHQKISFSAAGLFQVDRTLLFTVCFYFSILYCILVTIVAFAKEEIFLHPIVGATAKYMIILISFHTAKDNVF